MLVSVGAALFTLVSAYAWTDFTFSQASGVTFDPTRIAAQIVTGIGFIGAGAIIRQGLTVRGLTTAATLWMVAAIGMACGAGFYWAAVIATAIALVGLGPLRFVSKTMFDRPFRRELEVELAANVPAAPVLAALEQLGVGSPRSRSRLAAAGAAGLRHRASARGGLGGSRASHGRARRGLGRQVEPLCVRACARKTSTSAPSWSGSCRAGGSSCSRQTTTRRKRGTPSWRTRARRPSTAGGSALAGEWMLGEDSGLELSALAGRPGVQTARWAAGRHVERALEALDGETDRSARYVCELVALSPEGNEARGTGTLEGQIALEPRGDAGFGFDPVFVPAGEKRTVAELGDEWKAEHSHRARAAQALLAAIASGPASTAH